VKGLGLELFSPDEDRSAVVTAVRAPAGIDSGDVIRGVRDRFGITIANGQGELKGKIFRLGHIGWFDVFDITTQIGAVELVLADLGADVECGTAVTAALEAFAGEPSRT
jgi:aspartate aminotransferase-like enzyme